MNQKIYITANVVLAALLSLVAFLSQRAIDTQDKEINERKAENATLQAQVQADKELLIRFEERTRIQIEQLQADKEVDQLQSDQLKRLWPIMGKIKTALNEVRIKDGLPPVDTSTD